jgi:hypothetical protein
MIDLFTADLNNIPNDLLCHAVADFAHAQPNETNRHDFKLKWNDEAIKDVAAFANTFGGLLIVGVRKNQTDQEASVVGVESSSELTTGIASSIATNISPNPSFDIAECHMPGDPTHRFGVIRVRSDSTLHLVTKKGINNPVWFRNVDQTISADAAQLRMMIDREKQSFTGKQASLRSRADATLDAMAIGRAYQGDRNTWPMSNHSSSETFFKLAIYPTEEHQRLLDVSSERKFLQLVQSHYRRISSLLGRNPPVAFDAVNRSDDFYEYRWYHKSLQYEARWRITERLEVAHATQVREGEDNYWSLLDTVAYAILMILISSKWWESLKYFGAGVLTAHLSVPQLSLAQGASGQFVKVFGPGKGDHLLGPEVLDEHPQRVAARGAVSMNFAEMRNDIPDLVARLMNTLLRSLGHGVSYAEFRKDVAGIVNDNIT